MAETPSRQRQHHVWASLDDTDLPKAGSALKLKIRGPGNSTLGTLEVGSGGVFWKGKHRRRRQQMTWSEFATRMEQPLK